MKKPLVLCILDGCGLREETFGNAFKNANKPMFDYLWQNYPHTRLKASGKYVGLPENQAGNSEVGHLNIGSGRIISQPLQIINESIKSKEFFKNKNILEVINHVKENSSKLHIMGLISDGGVHSHINHLFSLVDMCKKNNISQIYFHLFTDGRDTDIYSAEKYIKKLEDKIKEVNLGVIATISGRYYAMDRDNNYDRIKLAYNAICNGIGNHYSDVSSLFEDQYKKNISDEFIIPSIINDVKLNDNDGIIVFNYRPDRLRELFSSITNPNFKEFKVNKYNNIKLVSMMPISVDVIGNHAFDFPDFNNTLGKYIDDLGLNQLRIAETEKYAHVTYYFDGGKEINLKNSKRILIKSPKVATYDLKPEMNAKEVTDRLLEEINKDYLDLVILNFANCDMVGHTGNYEAAIKAIEFLDKCLDRIYKKIKEIDGILIVTSDHGNLEIMINDDGFICTTHTKSEVPFLITKKDIKLREKGILADIAPTILDVLNISIPEEITGKSLII